jgi:hypothetical protein
MLNKSKSPQDDGLTYTNNGRNCKESAGNNIVGFEGCVQAAKEYLRFAQSHVQEFARFVETWESLQKHLSESQSLDTDATVSELSGFSMMGGSPPSSKSSSTIVEDNFTPNPNAIQTQDVKKFQSAFDQHINVYKDQELVAPTSVKSTIREKTMLSPQDRNKSLRPKFDLIKKTIIRSPKPKTSSPVLTKWRSSLKGENEPWVAFAPLGNSYYPRQSWTPSPPEELDRGVDQQTQLRNFEDTLPHFASSSPCTRSKTINKSTFTMEKELLNFEGTESLSMDFPIEDITFPDQESNLQYLRRPHENFRFDALSENHELYDHTMGSKFNWGLCFDQGMPQSVVDPSGSSMMASQSLLSPSQAQCPNSGVEDSSFNKDIYLQTVPSNRTLSLDATPWSMISQDTALLTRQPLLHTSTRKSPGNWLAS